MWFTKVNDLLDLAEEILNEPEFRPHGFVWKHFENKSADPLRSVQSTVDRMRELFDIEDHQFGPLCNLIHDKLIEKFDKF